MHCMHCAGHGTPTHSEADIKVFCPTGSSAHTVAFAAPHQQQQLAGLGRVSDKQSEAEG